MHKGYKCVLKYIMKANIYNNKKTYKYRYFTGIIFRDFIPPESPKCKFHH